jgi:hypothetical protein
MTDNPKVSERSASNAKGGTEQAKGSEPSGSAAKVQGFIGIVAITLGNVAAIITHVDQIRQFVSKVLGTEWVYRFHAYILYGACALFLLGYGSLTYWLYWNFLCA